jgi:hypothetical protein
MSYQKNQRPAPKAANKRRGPSSESLKFKIDDEPVSLAAARVFCQLYVLVVAQGTFEGAVERTRDLIPDVLADFGHYAIEPVTSAAPGATESVLRFRVSRTLERDVALRAFNFLSGHSGLLH